MFNKKILKAFTLLELIVVIVVLGILAMLAVPTFNTVKEKSADSVANKNASAVQRDYNAQAALAQSDPSIVPSATGAWVINGTSYSYTATAGNTGQNVTATKASSGGSGGGGSSGFSNTVTQSDLQTNRANFPGALCAYVNGSWAPANSITLTCTSGAVTTAMSSITAGTQIKFTFGDSDNATTPTGTATYTLLSTTLSNYGAFSEVYLIMDAPLVGAGTHVIKIEY